jgi:hypothetical protein
LQVLSYAQKADTEKKKLKSTFQNLSFLKIKTYDIIIQGDDTWNKDFADKKKLTRKKNTVKITVKKTP